MSEVSATVTAKLPALKPMNEVALSEFGNPVLSALVQQVAFDDQLKDLSEASEASRQFIGFELTKAMMKLHEENEAINLYAIWEGNKATEKLNNRILVALGVIKREAKDDDIVTTWTDTNVQALYDYPAIDKEKNEKEYTKRLNNRKRLNISLSNAVKAAIALIDGKTSSADLKFVEDETTKMIKPVIDNAPVSIAGENKEKKPVEFGKRTVATGGTHSPTLASLVSIATKAHKKEEGESEERSDKGGERSGDAKLGISDEVFGEAVNNLKRMISAQEGTFSEDKVKQMRSLVASLTETLAAHDKKPNAAQTAAADGGPAPKKTAPKKAK